jgi:hypothetical protein
MSKLFQTAPVKIYPQSPKDGLIVMHPGMGRKLDCYQTEYDFNLYTDQEDFINATDNYREVHLHQDNDCEENVLLVKNEIRKELGNPSKVKIFRKNDNLFFLTA